MGVSIRIGYGWQNTQGAHNADKDSKDAFKRLQTLNQDYPNQLRIAEYATHEKLLIVDSNTVVFGSANWLSNRKYKNSERSVVIEDPTLACLEQERAQTLIEQYQ